MVFKPGQLCQLLEDRGSTQRFVSPAPVSVREVAALGAPGVSVPSLLLGTAGCVTSFGLVLALLHLQGHRSQVWDEQICVLLPL